MQAPPTRLQDYERKGLQKVWKTHTIVNQSFLVKVDDIGTYSVEEVLRMRDKYQDSSVSTVSSSSNIFIKGNYNISNGTPNTT
jgi:hypothetical protein